jgi:hypothetical protein
MTSPRRLAENFCSSCNGLQIHSVLLIEPESRIHPSPPAGGLVAAAEVLDQAQVRPGLPSAPHHHQQRRVHRLG